MLEMWRNFSTFPLASLPVDVLFLVSEHLSHRDRGHLSRTSKYYRRFFESPRLWQNSTVCIKSKKVKTNVSVLKTIKKRKFKFIEFEVFDVELFRLVATILPSLENLILQKTPSKGEVLILALQSFSVCKNLRSLTIRGTASTPMLCKATSSGSELLAPFGELNSITLKECCLRSWIKEVMFLVVLSVCSLFYQN